MLTNKKKILLIVSIFIIILLTIILLISLNQSNDQQTDISVQTAEEYSGPPSTGLYGDIFEDFYANITESDLGYTQYALGDFFYNKIGNKELLTRAKINSYNQSYVGSQDIVNFQIIRDGEEKIYNVKIIRLLTGESGNKLVIDEYGFNVSLDSYTFNDDWGITNN